MSKDRLPKVNDLLWPTLKALERIGGSATIAEPVEEAARAMAIPEPLLDRPHGTGNATEFEYRSAWARSRLKSIGAIDNSERGVWTLQPRGRTFASEREVRDALRDYFRAVRTAETPEALPEGAEAAATAPGDGTAPDQAGSVDPPEPERGWMDRLPGILRDMPADAFERLCQRLLRESNFVEVEVTGRSGDGGIDGVGILKLNLLSFHVVFQAKRYRDAVQPAVVRDFRGGMVGRADKGLIITTGRFTAGAKREARRDGAPTIDLVDGDQPCDLMKGLKLGVTTRLVEQVDISPDFFREV